MQPECRELNSDPFAFLKNPSSTLRTDSIHFSNYGIFKNLAQPTVLDGSETFKIIRTYQKIDFIKMAIFILFQKNAKYGLTFLLTFLKLDGVGPVDNRPSTD